MEQRELTNLLIERRKALNLTQAQVAKMSKKPITRQYYNFIENGERRPSVEVAKSLSIVLGISWLLFFEVESNEKLHKDTLEVTA